MGEQKKPLSLDDAIGIIQTSADSICSKIHISGTHFDDGMENIHDAIQKVDMYADPEETIQYLKDKFDAKDLRFKETAATHTILPGSEEDKHLLTVCFISTILQKVMSQVKVEYTIAKQIESPDTESPAEQSPAEQYTESPAEQGPDEQNSAAEPAPIEPPETDYATILTDMFLRARKNYAAICNIDTNPPDKVFEFSEGDKKISMQFSKIAGSPEITQIIVSGKTDKGLKPFISSLDGTLQAYFPEEAAIKIPEVISRRDAGGLDLQYKDTPEAKRLSKAELSGKRQVDALGLSILKEAFRYEIRNDFYIENDQNKDLVHERCLIVRSGNNLAFDYEIKTANKDALPASCFDQVTAMFELAEFEPEDMKITDPEVAKEC